MSMLIIKQSSGWVHIPATDVMRPYWINLNTVRTITWSESPVSCTLHYINKVQQTLNGLQAIAIIDAVAELTGGEKFED